jgi:putative peptide zinc metalloprotease protein
MIGDPDKMEAVLVVDQTEIEFIRQNQLVEVNLDEYPGEKWTGRINEIATIDLQVAPRALSSKAGGGLSTETDKAGAERPASVSYQARVALENNDERLSPGFRGRAKVHVGSRTLGKAILRYLADTIRFK